MCSSFFNTLSTYVIIHCCYVIRFRNMQLQPYSIKFIDIRLHNCESFSMFEEVLTAV